MYYRRKVLLALLEALDREISKTALQKYLFLATVEQAHPSYEFVPYRYGCFSFQADADKRTLTKYGFIRDQDNWILVHKRQFFHLLKHEDQNAILRVAERVGHLSNTELIQHVYREYPYYAINSEIRHEILDRREQAKVDAARPANRSQARLFTIGYEGQSLERYLNRLIDCNIKALCDVRRNPLSMKFGFSKQQLRKAAEGLGIAYIHLPELGIESKKRRDLHSPSDYSALFNEYTQTTLAQSTGALRQIMSLINKYDRVALTCFESDHGFCHRSCIVDALTHRNDFHYRVTHL